MRLFLSAVLLVLSFCCIAQIANIYNPEADALSTINKGLLKAKAENKHLFIQVGGNWCPWCIKFHEFCSKDREIKDIIDKGFVPVLVNYSKENKNPALLKRLGYPQRFGFPVFVVLDSEGNRIHTQNSAYMEEGSGYSKKKIVDFLKNWSPESLDPDQYREKE